MPHNKNTSKTKCNKKQYGKGKPANNQMIQGSNVDQESTTKRPNSNDDTVTGI